MIRARFRRPYPSGRSTIVLPSMDTIVRKRAPGILGDAGPAVHIPRQAGAAVERSDRGGRDRAPAQVRDRFQVSPFVRDSLEDQVSRTPNDLLRLCGNAYEDLARSARQFVSPGFCSGGGPRGLPGQPEAVARMDSRGDVLHVRLTDRDESRQVETTPTVGISQPHQVQRATQSEDPSDLGCLFGRALGDLHRPERFPGAVGRGDEQSIVGEDARARASRCAVRSRSSNAACRQVSTRNSRPSTRR